MILSPIIFCFSIFLNHSKAVVALRSVIKKNISSVIKYSEVVSALTFKVESEYGQF